MDYGNNINVLTGTVIGAAIEVHKHLGPGLLESTYEACLCKELELQKIGSVQNSVSRYGFQVCYYNQRRQSQF